jgi:hypothetical protein
VAVNTLKFNVGVGQSVEAARQPGVADRPDKGLAGTAARVAAPDYDLAALDEVEKGAIDRRYVERSQIAAAIELGPHTRAVPLDSAIAAVIMGGHPCSLPRALVSPVPSQ